MDEYFNSELNKLIQNHKEFMKSQKYQQEIKYFERLISDFALAVRGISLYSSRYYNLYENSLVIRHVDELLESAIACEMLVENGMINPARRDLRYMLESTVKYLVVDQNIKDASYDEKIKYFDDNIPKSSISCVNEIEIISLKVDDNKKFIDSVNDVYKKLCKYIHPSKHNIDELIKREKKGAYLGLETDVEIRSLNNLVFKVFELIICCYFTVLGFSLSGDIFIYALDGKTDWKFNKSKYIKIISHSYDYKIEKQNR